MEYTDLVLSGKNASQTIYSGDYAYNTLVRNSAKLRISAGGSVELTTVMNSTTISNAGYALSTYLSGGTMLLSSGGVANSVHVLRNARLTVSPGAVATDLYVSSGNVTTTVRGGDDATLVTGVNEKGDFFLSSGVASNFLMNSLGQLTVSSGGSAADTTIRFGGYLTVMSGGRATGIEQSAGGFVRADVYGGDQNTVACGVNASGSFSLSGGVASNFILYDGGAQQVFSGGTAIHTLVSGQRAFQYVWSHGVTSNTSVFKNGCVNVYDGGIARDVTVSAGGSMVTCDGGRVHGATVFGTLLIDSGSTGEGESGGFAVISDVTVMPDGTLDVNRRATFSDAIVINGTLKIAAGITIGELTVSSGGTALVSGTFGLAGSSWNTVVGRGGVVNASAGALLLNLETVSGARVNFSSGAVLAGTRFAIAENTIYCSGTALGMTASGGVISDLGADGKAYGLTFGSGVVVSGARVVSDGVLELASAATAEETTLLRGGMLKLNSGANTGRRLFFDFSDTLSGGTMTALVNDFSLISSETALCLAGTSDGGVYTVSPDGTAELFVSCAVDGLYDNAVKAGTSSINAFSGMIHTFDAAGATISATAFEVDSAAAAASLDSSAEVGGRDRAIRWTDATAAGSGTVALVADDFAGDAWLDIDGTALGETTLVGAAAVYGGTVNIRAAGGAELGNLAAGAAAGGSVGGVRLTVGNATLGLAYAGGMGTVEGDVATLVSGGSLIKDLYAGALANYAKTHTRTSAGDVYLEFRDGVVSSGANIYGAAAVKAGTLATAGGDAAIHSVDAVTLTLAGGYAEHRDLCIFAGGYATGHDTGKQSPVYTVRSVDVTVAGGSWGAARGGRGIFGGAFAGDNSKSGPVCGVLAEVGDVNITVTGGETGNIYGGGWAQKGAVSTVGSVNITIAGGTVGHIFGGGSHSTQNGSEGSTTEVDDVTITVSGGKIEGDIFARGQLDGDSVNGEAEIIFTGAEDFDCGAWGYSYVGGEDASGALLSFRDYTGKFSGEIGGFAGTTLGGNTAMTLATAAENIANNAWSFDVSERDGSLAGTVMLNWTKANFTHETSEVVITLNLPDAAPTEWSLIDATAKTGYGRFDVQIDGASVLPDTIGLDEVIADGECAGWGFTVEGTTLKFKQLA